MSSPPSVGSKSPGVAIGFREFVAMMAMVMGMHAAGVDTMLPALPELGRALHIDTENHRQWVISAYMLGFGATQIFFGPLSDRYGRRPVLLIGLICYGITSLVASFAASFTLMLGARVLQGMAGAAGRVIILSIVRDRYAGSTMARVMSLISMVFLAVPILAPSIGQFILLFAPWRAIFFLLALYGFASALWVSFRLPETLDPANRRSIRPSEIWAGFGIVVRDRHSLGYTLATMINFGALLGYIMSCQQLFTEVFGVAHLFALLFAASSAGLAVAAFTNSRIVEALGSRTVSHVAMLMMAAVTGTHLLWSWLAGDSLVSFMLFQMITMMCVGLSGSNFSALAMESMGALAGTASSVQGATASIGATVVGIMIGQSYDGTALPVIGGFFICALLVVTIVTLTERGRLFGRA